jgi:predicted DNA-binding ribbon-helix-helix protein
MMDARPRKRSLVIAGHATSLSLEDAFWDALRDMAAARGCSIADIVTEVDAARTRDASGTRPASLSGALRTHVLAHYRARAETGRDPGEP